MALLYVLNKIRFYVCRVVICPFRLYDPFVKGICCSGIQHKPFGNGYMCVAGDTGLVCSYKHIPVVMYHMKPLNQQPSNQSLTSFLENQQILALPI